MCEEPIVSVIMSVYNQLNFEQLHDAVESVLLQTFKNFEFIIYNDGSDNRVSEKLHEYAKKDSRIRLIENTENNGLAYSLNTCINMARGKYLARMDDDDISDVNRLYVQYTYLEQHPEISYVGCNAKLIDSNGVWGIRRMPENPRKESFLRYSPFIHPTVMIRKSVFNGCEAYRVDKTTWRCEDYELFMRLLKLGHRGCNIQEALFFYREDKKSYKKRKFRYRVDEARLRYRNFKELQMMFPFGWWYVIRPLLATLVPSFIILLVRKLKHLGDMDYATGNRKKTEEIQVNFAEGSKTVRRI